MKRMVLISGFFLLTLAAARAGTSQSLARGSYQFYLEDGLLKTMDFDASTDERGVTTGSFTFTDEAKLPDVDDPEDPAGRDGFSLYVKAEIDGMTVEKNRALLSGKVLDSSHKTYIGKWVQFVVEDNGTNREVPDRLVWTLCQPQPGSWVPSDAELRSDNGAYLHWWATDAERKDDVGIPSRDLLGKDTGCPVYPLATYLFADVLKWNGDIVVQP